MTATQKKKTKFFFLLSLIVSDVCTMLEIIIRKADENDAGVIARLLTELGYPRSSEFARTKIKELEGQPSALILVAVVDKEVIGVLSFHAMPLFHDHGMLGRISALSVD